MALLKIEDLKFRYAGSDVPVVNGVSLALERGGFYVLCGDTGCGKTTLLRLLRRPLRPQGALSGSILWDGVADTAADIGFVGQDPQAQIVTDKVWHELAFGLENLGAAQETIRRRVGETAAWFGLEKSFRKDTNALSGGEKQLLGLAAAAITQPKLLLLDEPTAQLDPIAANAFLMALERLNREFGVTVLLAEHRLEEVLPAADGVFAMREGKLAAAGTPRETARQLKNDPLFAGFPTAARLWAQLDGESDPPLQVREGKRFLADCLRGKRAAFTPPPAPAPAQPVLEAKGIWLRYEKEQPDVLRDFSCTLHKQEILCILGGNGAGKTTALQVLAGMRRGYRGRVSLYGRRLTGARKNERQDAGLAYLPQNVSAAFLKASVRQDLEAQLTALGEKKERLPALIDAAARRYGIAPLLDRHPLDLSGGERQSAALAKLLLGKPSILLLDEPTKGLDAAARLRLAKTLRDLRAEGMSILIVTHDAEFAAPLADRCAMLFDGSLINTAPPAAFFAENSFFTTAASRIAREQVPGAVLCADIVQAVQNAAPEREAP